MLLMMQGLVSPRVEVHPQLKPALLSLAQVESIKWPIPGTLCHHLSFSLQVLPFRPVGSLFFLLVSLFFSSQAQAELSLLTPLSSLRNSHPIPFPFGLEFPCCGSSSQCGDLPPASLPINSTGPCPHPPPVQPPIFILSLVRGPFLFSSLFPLPFCQAVSF